MDKHTDAAITAEALEYSRRLFDNMLHWYQNADSKAQVILGGDEGQRMRVLRANTDFGGCRLHHAAFKECQPNAESADDFLDQHLIFLDKHSERRRG